MKKSVFKDYRMASEYFTDNEDYLKSDIQAVEKQKSFLVWVQEFSKKIVVVIFIMYILTSIANLILVYLSFKTGVVSGIDTLISETNSTFREVVGGYIVKSAVENSFKIAGNYLVGVYDARLRAMKTSMSENGIKGLDSNGVENNNFDESSIG